MKFFKYTNGKVVIIAGILLVNLAINCFFYTVTDPLSSDKISHMLLLDGLFHGTQYLPPDNFIFDYFYYLPLTVIFDYHIHTFIIILLINLAILWLGYLAFYFLYVKRTISHQFSLLFFIPIIILINSPHFLYQFLTSQDLRVPLIGVGFFILFLIEQGLLDRPKFTAFFIMLLLLTLLFFNDPLFIFNFGLPLVVACILFSLLKRKLSFREIIIVALIILGYGFSSFGKFMLEYFHIVSINPTNLQLGDITKNIRLLIDAGSAILVGQLPLALINVLFLILGGIGLLILLPDHKNRLVNIFFPFAFLAVCSEFILSSNASDIYSARYLMFLPFLLPFGLLVLIRKLQLRRVLRGHWTFLVVLVVSIIYINQSLQAFAVTRLPDYAQNYQIIRALWQENVTYGYAPYWEAGMNTFLSENRIKIRQINCQGRTVPYLWLANSRWYDKTNYNKSFLLFKNFDCDVPAIRGQFGESIKTISLPGQKDTYSIFIYNYNIADNF